MFKSLSDSRIQISLVVSGGGSGALQHCFRREGASRLFVEGVIPYSHAAMVDYLGCAPSDASASASVAKQLASVALQRAGRLHEPQAESHKQPVGIALVAALPTTPRRRGRDRIHVARLTQDSPQSPKRGMLLSIELTKDAYSREQAESIADEMIRMAISGLATTESDDSFFQKAGLDLQSQPFEA